MKNVIIVSKCLRVTKLDPKENWYEFHFKGVYAGRVLKRVLLQGGHESSFMKGEEYVLLVHVLTCEDGILKGSILKSKSLEDCWDRS